MNNWFGVDPVLPVWTIVVLSLPFFGYCLYKEFSRRQKFLLARIIALTFLLVSTLGIALRPSVRSDEKPRGIILLPGEYVRAKVDSIIAVNPTVSLFATADASPYDGATVIPLNSVGTLSSVDVILGSGL